ncbi:class I SAM-dependent methyltransferase [Actinoalloteichus spitiensis]|uniref:class I SAM-dependent methyltransferase n=1 Tax=Actinoalloteichus spitiensis TaxID=252394 RepID=UPI00036AEFDB|nr:methyltransferase domain-containing protein [Actinoalloteichus spitiensis]
MPDTVWDAALYDQRHGFVSSRGDALLDLVAPCPGDHILDVGCGTGDHVAALRNRGAHVVGLDSSPEMVGRARRKYPDLRFVTGDLLAVGPADLAPFPAAGADAILSNATLHWIPEASRAARALFRLLRPGGRLVAELGGAGNVATIVTEAERLRAGEGLAAAASPWYFPTLAGWAAVLETAGFEVRAAWHFDRPTPLEGDDGLATWVRMFGGHLLVDVRDRDAFLSALQDRLREPLFREGTWYADYRRLRVVAVRSS